MGTFQMVGSRLSNQMIGIYIHIPFCKRQCFYCHFVKGPYEESLVDRYVDALVGEIRLVGEREEKQPEQVAAPGGRKREVDTIYIGGGSPSLLKRRHLQKIVEALRESFRLSAAMEFTIEVNPEDVLTERLWFYRQVGINRISIGSQSFVSGDLEYLKRPHTVRQSMQAVELALGSGFSNISVDFIISLPTQTPASLTESFAYLKELPIPHVSAYLLEEVEEGEAKDERDNLHYYIMRDCLGAMGYMQYEVSNFSKSGNRSRHNLKYWLNDEYIGLGVSASGYLGGIDYKNPDDPDEYFRQLDRELLPCQIEGEPAVELRRIVTGLRLMEGVPAHYLEVNGEARDMLLESGFLIRLGDNIALHPSKILLLNEVLSYFFE